ncbi:MAG: bifunctional alpha,alpha-trehalose-phosphate synthase (UDP-forming)/trehalose-phosphatase [Bacteroidales bacterium]|nr:bifunctional alpha,alpha-trehalose-phosphate synthase (UDP-forming)/trehalose-phosphatase [Bacteroidales bacterium]
MKAEKQFERLVIAAYRLPFRFVRSKSGVKTLQNSGGLVSAILALSESFKHKNSGSNDHKILWAGIIDNLPENYTDAESQNEHFDMVPVKISPKLNSLFYEGFCNNLIWPLFHYFSSYSVFNNSYFRAYEDVNSIFCEELVRHLKPGDFIWIHDYQLLLLPAMIREKMPDVTIGFFLHIPFPSYEVFRLLPRNWRESIVLGLLGADLVGFHTHDYTQHFIKSVKRTTGYECRQNIIVTPDRAVKADAFPIGIDYDKFHNASGNKSVVAAKQKYQKCLPGQKLIFSLDRLDYSKGLLSRLKGYETFLEKYPEWRLKVVFNMVVVPSRDSIENYKEMKKEIESTVGRINGKYSTLSWRPVIYQYKSLSFNDLVALYDLSDVGLITPLRDGMNLVAKEYIACQKDNKGVLILSEMAGAASELSEAIIINPADHVEIADAIYTALEMKTDEKQVRVSRMQNRIADYNVFTWAFDFFNQTYEIKKQQDLMGVKFINETITAQMVADYKKANRRILFLDYDGTVVPFAKYPELATIDDKTLNIIKGLTDDPKNHIVIISGRGKDFLEKQFKKSAVTLIAEHGYFIKKAGREWESTFHTDDQWKEAVMPIMTDYVNRCNGTFIEEKAASIAWHYRNADSDFAQLRLHELRDDLAEIIRHKTDFEILEGNKVLEVKSSKYNKGLSAATLITDEYYGFILAAGDDNTDEFLFQALPDFVYSIRIGLSPSFARYNLPDTSQLLQLLEALVK